MKKTTRELKRLNRYHVQGRTADSFRHGSPRQMPGEPEVRNFENGIEPGAAEKQILRLEISMDQTFRPQKMETSA